MKYLLWILGIFVVIGIIAYAWPLFVVLFVLWIALKIYESVYFKSEKFLSIKGRIQSYIDDCNELNRHIEELKDTPLEINRLNLGTAEYRDNSKWNAKKSKANKQSIKYAPNVYNCSKTVIAGARNKPFDYVCKYFGVKADEETLEKFETILNNFEAAEEGKTALKAERQNILSSIQSDIPTLIGKFCKKRIEKELGFEEVDFETAYYPRYEFAYVSQGGNKSETYQVIMDIPQLNNFVIYLSEKIKFSKSVAGQRALMTSKLRQKIKERDGFACKQCGASVSQEPHLLLEIDHIIPVSKGGLTTEDNLQTLCWRCNRSKGAKM